MPQIDHVVVLMLENRSFDNVLGYLDHPDPEFDGVRDEGLVNATCRGTPVPVSADGVPCGIDPGHSHAEALAQMGGAHAPDMSGFVCSHQRVLEARGHDPGAAGAVVQCLDPMTWNPALATLALEFAVCTRWHSSVPGETWPNRSFAHAATSDGTVDIELGLYWDRTIFELLEEAGRSWRIYYDGPPHVWCYRRLWGPRTIWDLFGGRRPRTDRWFRAEELAEHIAAGELPAYAFVEPAHTTLGDGGRRTNSQHPGNNTTSTADFVAGDVLIGEVYGALRANEALFARTLLVITYDEHGGLYDHVPPEVATPPGDPSDRRLSRWIGRIGRRLADRIGGRPPSPEYDFRRLGVRVPAVLVSPWIDRHSVVRDRLEHASIPATLREHFAADAPPLTARDAAAGTFHRVVLDSLRTAPRTGRSGAPVEDALPDLSELPRTEARGHEEASSAEPGPTDVDLALDALSQRVGRTLSSRRARLRRGRRAGPEVTDAPTPAARAVALFEAAAEQARTRR